MSTVIAIDNLDFICPKASTQNIKNVSLFRILPRRLLVVYVLRNIRCVLAKVEYLLVFLGLRKLVVSEVDSPAEASTTICNSSSSSSSTESVGMKRLFEVEEKKSEVASNVSSTDQLDWRPLLEDKSEVAANVSSTDQLNWRPLFHSVDLLPTGVETASLSDLNLGWLFKENKEIGTSVSGVQLRKWLSKADPQSLSDLGLAILFGEDPTAAAKSLSNVGLDRLFKEGATEPKSCCTLYLDQLFKDNPKLQASLSNVGLERLFKEGVTEPKSCCTLYLDQLFKDHPKLQASLSNVGLERLFKEGAAEPKSLGNLCLDQLFKDDPKLRESLSNLGMRRLFHPAKPAAASLSDLGVRQLYQRAEGAEKDNSAAKDGTVGQNSQELGGKYWVTRSSVCSIAHTAHSFACSGLLASLAPSAALTPSLARSLRSFASLVRFARSLRSLPRTWGSE